MVPGWLAGFLGCVRDPVADSIQNLCDPRISGKDAFFSYKNIIWNHPPSVFGSANLPSQGVL